MARIQIDTEQLATVAGRQSAIAARIVELSGELEAAVGAAAGAAGDAGLTGAVGDCGSAWSQAFSHLAGAVHGYSANAGAAAAAYRETDSSAMPGAG